STSENQGGEQRFDVQRFRVEGTVLLSEEEIQAILEPHKGPNKSIKDIEKAKQVLEDAFHSRGYSSILVTVPEQTIEGGTVRLEVIEGRIEKIKVTNNQYYSLFNIFPRLPPQKIGDLLSEPLLVKELDALNANPDLKVAPLLSLGSEPGLVNVELKTRDRFPGHFRLQGDNQG